jgi:hypothetical protein
LVATTIIGITFRNVFGKALGGLTVRVSINWVSPNSTEQTEHFALSTGISDAPGQSGILIHDDPDDLDDGPERLDKSKCDVPEGYPLMALISKAFQSFKQGKVPTFLDSGASDTMFVSKEAFTDYWVTQLRQRMVVLRS